MRLRRFWAGSATMLMLGVGMVSSSVIESAEAEPTSPLANELAVLTDNMYPSLNNPASCSSGTMSGGACRTDGSGVSYHFQQSARSTGMEDAVADTISISFNPTVLEFDYAAVGDYTAPYRTDVVYQVNSSGFTGGGVGVTWCIAALSSEKCDQHYVRFRYASYDRNLACHETGHAVGLMHGDKASPAWQVDSEYLRCMKLGGYQDPFLGVNNTCNINLEY